MLKRIICSECGNIQKIDVSKDRYTILSFGGGVQSTALVILASQGKLDIDAVVFCDTGFEQTSTFQFLELYTKPLLDSIGIPFYIAKTQFYAKQNFGDLHLPPFFSYKSNDPTSIARMPSFCSYKWKKNVFERFIRVKFNLKRYKIILGFSIDEAERAKNLNSIEKYLYTFPLLDLKLSRNDCIDLIAKQFGVVPSHSSCYFCPNHTRKEWREILNGDDREKVIKFDNELRSTNYFLTHECVPIMEVDFHDKNESFYSRQCVNSCYL